MIEIHSDLFIIDKFHDLAFSEADELETGKGWYITKEIHKTSQLFASKDEAIIAFENKKLIYD